MPLVDVVQATEGEAHFVVVHPAHGPLVLENW